MTLTDLPTEMILEIALHCNRRTQFSLYSTCHYFHYSLSQFTSIFKQISSIQDQRTRHILSDSGWTFFHIDESIIPINCPHHLAIDFQFIRRPISTRSYWLFIAYEINFNGFQRLLNGNQFHFLQFIIYSNDPLVWSILGEANTEHLNIEYNLPIKNRKIIQKRFESFALKSPVVHLKLSSNFFPLFLQFAHLFKNLQSIKFDDLSDSSKIDLNDIRNRCPNLKSIVGRTFYDKILEIDWQMDEIEVDLNLYSTPPPPPKLCKKLSIILDYSDDFYFDLTLLRDSLECLKIEHNECVIFQFISDFLQNNKTLQELQIVSYAGLIDLLPFQMSLNRFSIYFYNSNKITYHSLVKFINTQSNLEEFRFTNDTVHYMEDNVLDLIEGLIFNLKLKSIIISTSRYSNITPLSIKKLVKVLSRFQGRDLIMNGVPINTLLRDIDPDKIPDCVLTKRFS